MADAVFDWADPLLFNGQLSEDERMVRDNARRFCEDKLLPRVRDDFRHERFDPALLTDMGEMGFLGATLPEEQGGAGLNYVAYGLIAREVEAGIAMAKVLEHGRIGIARLEIRAEVRAGHHRDSSHSRAYSGKRLLSCACINLRALKR